MDVGRGCCWQKRLFLNQLSTLIGEIKEDVIHIIYIRTHFKQAVYSMRLDADNSSAILYRLDTQQKMGIRSIPEYIHPNIKTSIRTRHQRRSQPISRTSEPKSRPASRSNRFIRNQLGVVATKKLAASFPSNVAPPPTNVQAPVL